MQRAEERMLPCWCPSCKKEMTVMTEEHANALILSHHHQNHSTTKVKNQTDRRRCVVREICEETLDPSYKALYGDAMLCPSEGHKYGGRKQAKKNMS